MESNPQSFVARIAALGIASILSMNTCQGLVGSCSSGVENVLKPTEWLYKNNKKVASKELIKKNKHI